MTSAIIAVVIAATCSDSSDVPTSVPCVGCADERPRAPRRPHPGLPDRLEGTWIGRTAPEFGRPGGVLRFGADQSIRIGLGEGTYAIHRDLLVITYGAATVCSGHRVAWRLDIVQAHRLVVEVVDSTLGPCAQRPGALLQWTRFRSMMSTEDDRAASRRANHGSVVELDDGPR